MIVDPGKVMSFQKHFKRNEIWLVSEGSCIVHIQMIHNKNKKLQLNKFDHYLVPVGHWHQITILQMKTHIIEIQYGEDCIEE